MFHSVTPPEQLANVPVAVVAPSGQGCLGRAGDVEFAEAVDAAGMGGVVSIFHTPFSSVYLMTDMPW